MLGRWRQMGAKGLKSGEVREEASQSAVGSAVRSLLPGLKGSRV